MYCEKTYFTFLESYLSKISPKLKEIDILIKTCDDEISVYETSSVLEISFEEVENIMHEKNIDIINKVTFFTIMKNGSSEICKLYNREIICGSPLSYTQENISYIYDIDHTLVRSAFCKLNIKEATSFTLPQIFANIEVCKCS